jgi:hypothetical protein
MALLSDLEEFVADHRPHGTMAGDATTPAWNGYRLTVDCPCGVSSSDGLPRRTLRLISYSLACARSN